MQAMRDDRPAAPQSPLGQSLLHPLSVRPAELLQVGTLIDETGCIVPGKLVWSNPAWEQLFGRAAEQFVEGSAQVLKALEQRLLFLRVNLLFGWSGEVGRLAISGVSLLP